MHRIEHSLVPWRGQRGSVVVFGAAVLCREGFPFGLLEVGRSDVSWIGVAATGFGPAGGSIQRPSGSISG
eukprot:5576136-Prymnesium_polylepis.1